MKKRTVFAAPRPFARRMKFRNLLPLFALAACEEPTTPDVVALDLQPALAVAGSGPIASGSGHLVDTRGGPLAGEPGLRNFSFTASSSGGVFQVVNRTFNIRLHGSLECVTVFGSEAWFAGPVTQSTRPDVIPVGSIRAFYVVDNGEGQGMILPDQIANSRRVGSAQAWCDDTFPRALNDIEQGNIQVR